MKEKAFSLTVEEIAQIKRYMKNEVGNTQAKRHLAKEVRRVIYHDFRSNWYYMIIEKKADAVLVLKQAVDFLEGRIPKGGIPTNGDAYVLAQKIISSV